MKRLRVKSNNVHSIGYDRKKKILEVQFHSGTVYAYYDVPEEVYYSFRRHPSPGSFFHNAIKTKYEYVRQDKDE